MFSDRVQSRNRSIALSHVAPSIPNLEFHRVTSVCIARHLGSFESDTKLSLRLSSFDLAAVLNETPKLTLNLDFQHAAVTNTSILQFLKSFSDTLGGQRKLLDLGLDLVVNDKLQHLLNFLETGRAATMNRQFFHNKRQVRKLQFSFRNS